MAYRYGDREQRILFPASLEEYVKAEDPVRAYDIFINAIDFEELGLEIDENKVGNAEYFPRVMLKLIVYGTSYGWRSARKLERAIHHNVSFIWLMGGLKPDHKTISEFRRKNKRAIIKVLKQCVRVCIKLNLIEGNILFCDGTKIRANAARAKNYSKQQYELLLVQTDKRIEDIFDECEQLDEQESEQSSLVKMKKELNNKQLLQQEIRNILKEFKKQGEKTKNGAEKTINKTDPDSALMKSIQGSHASYNVQQVVDDKHGLIVASDLTSKATDYEQLSKQITGAESNIGKQCNVVCADAGYSDIDDLVKLDRRALRVIVPNQEQASEKETKPFSKREFIYDEKNNKYICPEGHDLILSSYEKRKNQYRYRITSKNICKGCKHYGVCTKDPRGRALKRLFNEKTREKLAAQYTTEKSQLIYKRRKTRAEHPFGHIKRNLGINNFLLRGREGAKTEISIASTCFNITRMITLFGGVENFIANIATSKG